MPGIQTKLSAYGKFAIQTKDTDNMRKITRDTQINVKNLLEKKCHIYADEYQSGSLYAHII